MGAIATYLDERFAAERRSGTYRPAQWLIDCFSGGASASGVRVTEKTAMQYTPFWASVRIISGTVGALPFMVYQRLAGGGKERAPGHKAYALLHDRPNEHMDAVTFLETRQAHVLTYGNGYAEIQRDGAGRPVALWPLLPDRTNRKIKDGVPYYEVQVAGGQVVPLPDANVLHIKGLGFDGYTGYNVAQFHREALGYGMAVKEFGSRFFSNDGNPGGVLEHPKEMSDTAYKRLNESWAKNHEGLSNAHRMQILEEGMKWAPTGIDPAKAQALEVQKFTVDDCSRIFLIPPHMISSMEFSKYNNVEQLQIEFVTRTMLYWFRKWEQEVNYKLLMPSERRKVFCEILVEALLRGNIEARGEYYAKGRQGGWFCVDDIRERENLNPLPGGAGKIFLEPLNMVPAGTQQVPPAEPAEPDDNIRSAHHNLIAGQWARVITKQNNALRKTVKSGFWSEQRLFAAKVLADPLHAYASVCGVPPTAVDAILQRAVAEAIGPDIPLQGPAAETLTEKIMEAIGGPYADA